MQNHAANLITGFRILCSLLLLLLPPFSVSFCIVYLLCGISDMADGIVARRTDSASEAGARLDTAADFIFAGVCLIRLLPVLSLPGWVWIWLLGVAVIKAGNAAAGFILYKKLIAIHSFLNKAAGLLLFLLPLTLRLMDPKYSAAGVCAVATLAALQEGYYVLTGWK